MTTETHDRLTFVAAIDWDSVWDWFAQPEVSIPLVVLLLGIAYQQGTRRSDRKERRSEKESSRRELAEAERLRQEELLESTHVTFGRWASVAFGPGTGRPTNAAVTIEVYDASVWIHGVRLSWRYRTDAEDGWRLEDAPCAPHEAGVTFPVSVPQGEILEVAWPGMPIPQQEANYLATSDRMGRVQDRSDTGDHRGRGLNQLFVRGGPSARHCAQSTPGPAVVRPILGRRFQIASERLIWPRSMRSSASFAMAGPIGARDAALSMRSGSRQLRTDRWPSTGQSQ